MGFVFGVLGTSLGVISTPTPAFAAPTVGLVYQLKADGTPSWDATDGPGNDTGPSNGITRNQDVVSLNWGINVNGQAADSSSITQTLPVGMVWDLGSSPSACVSVVYSNDNRTITCDLGAISAGSAFDMTATARVSGNNAHGTTLVMPSPVFTATNATGTSTIGPLPSLQTISSGRPKVNVRKDRAPWSQVFAYGPDGTTPGVVMYYPISLEIIGGGKGSEALDPAQDIVLTDTFSEFLAGTGTSSVASGTPNPTNTARLYTWGAPWWGGTNQSAGCWYNGDISTPHGVHRYWDLPYGSPNVYGTTIDGVGGTADPTHLVTDAGQWSCSQPGGPGSPITVRISGSDTSGDNRPMYGGLPSPNLYALPADTTVLNAGNVGIWYPVSDFPTTANGASPAYQLDVRNRIEFATQLKGLSGQPNDEMHNTAPYNGQDAGPNVSDPWYQTNDNNYVHTIVGYAGDFNKWYRAGEFSYDGGYGPYSYWPGGATGYRTGDGFVGPGTDFSSAVERTNGGFLAQDATLCDKFDNTWMELLPLTTPTASTSPTGTQGAFLISGYTWSKAPLPAGRAFTIEYGVVPFSTIDELRRLDCSDARTTWYSDLAAVPGGPSAVNFVRAKLRIEPGEDITLITNLRAKPDAPENALLTNFGTFSDQYYNGGGGQWAEPVYSPANDGSGTPLVGKPWDTPGYVSDATLPLAYGYYGDRLRVGKAQARVIKKTVNGTTADDTIGSVRAGNTVTFELAPTFTSYLVTKPVAEHFYIYDILDEWVTYVAGSSVANPNSPAIAQPTVTPSTDPVTGKKITVLKWDLGQRTAGQPLPTVRYKVRTKSLAPGGTVTNNSVIVDAVDALGNSWDGSGCQPKNPPFSIGGSTDLTWALPSTTTAVSSRDASCPRGWSRNVTINQVSSLTIGKTVVESAIEQNGTYTFRVTYANVQETPPLTNVEVIDALPEVGDGRDPANAWVGTARLVPGSLQLVESLGTGTITVRYTKDPKTAIRSIMETDPANPLPVDTVKWCLESEFGTAGCPLNSTEVTGWRLSDTGVLEKGDYGIIEFKMVTKDNLAGNIYTNRTVGKAAEVSLPVSSNDVSIPVVAGSISNFVWEDLNGNGKQDAGEPGIDGATAELLNTDGTPVLRWSAAGPDGVRGTSDDVYVPYVVTTAGGGLYSFDNVHSGDYQVRFTPPTADYELTLVRQGTDTAGDSNPDATAGPSIPGRVGYTTPVIHLACRDASGVDLSPGCDPVVLASVDSDPTIDAGFVRRVSIGDYVWVDTNGDGKQGPAAPEPPVAGATATLWVDADGDPATSDWTQVTTDITGAPLPNGGVDTTGADGLYLFENLRPAIYQVRFTTPAGYVLTDPAKGTDRTLDSDAVFDLAADPTKTTGATAATLVPSGVNERGLDAGVLQPAAIGDIVWNDVSGDGVQGDPAAEPGIADAKVTLWRDADGDPATTDWVQVTQDVFGATFGTGGTITTGADGAYLFDKLAPGTYQVRFEAPPGKSFTQPNAAAATDATDSDAVPTSLTTAASGPYTLVSGQRDLTVDAGVTVPSAIGDKVWLDFDGNGLQGDPATEPGIDGATVTIERQNPDGTWATSFNGIDGQPYTTSQQTAGGGNYLFGGLIPGTYRVKFDPPTGYFLTTPDANAGGSDATDSDPSLADQYSPAVTLAPGETNTTVDAGVFQVAGVGDYVWNDLDADGVQDAGEPGIGGVFVELLDVNGNVVGSTTTAADGKWGIDRLGADQTDQTATPLSPGTYSVRFTRPAPVGGLPWIASPSSGTPDDTALNSDAPFASNTAATATTGQFQLTSLEVEPDIDAGFFQPVSIGDLVWEDANADGLQGDAAAEPPVAGAQVTLWKDADGDLTTTDWVQVTADLDGTTFGAGGTITTGADGLYLFDNLVPGTYQVRFTAPTGTVLTGNDAGNDAADSDAIPGAGTPGQGATMAITLASGDAPRTWDAGVFTPTSVGDYVWNDVNGDGQQGAAATEPPVAGAKVTLWKDADGDPATADWAQVTADIAGATFGTGGTITTGADGAYLFDNLKPGVYQVRFEAPAGTKLTSPLQGADTTVDSDATPDAGSTTTGSSASITLASGDARTDVDAGVYQVGSIGDTVWVDTDGDGQQGDPATEPGVGGAKVTLWKDADGDPTTSDWVQVTADADGTTFGTGGELTTGADGKYLFGNLRPGIYQARFVPPPGYLLTQADQGADATDSDAGLLGVTGPITLAGGQDITDVDAGVYLPLRVGDLVWDDLDANGVQDAGEPGLGGLLVELLDSAGNVVGSTTTAADGTWAIDRTGADQTDTAAPLIFPGDYSVRFTSPGGTYVPSETTGAPDTLADDSDAVFAAKADPTGTTTVFSLSSGEQELDVDTGFWKPVSVGDFVWLDNNGDGVQGPVATEPPVAGAKVTLWMDADGDPATQNDWVQVTADIDGAVFGTAGTITTVADGKYLFDNLKPGIYQVRFEAPAGMVLTANDEGADDAADSDAVRDASKVRGATAPIVLKSGDARTDIDAGVYVPAKLGNRVFEDLNRDGVQTPGEPGVANVPVILTGTDGAGNPVSLATFTRADGTYEFKDLAPGTYTVSVLPSGAWTPTLSDQGGNDATDSDINPTDVNPGPAQQFDMIPVTVVSGTDDQSWDAGLVRAPALSGHVYVDDNNDGVRQSSERGIGGVTLRLTGNDINGNPVDLTATTDATGYYLFPELLPSDTTGYTVTETQPGDYFDGKDRAGTTGGDSTTTNDVISGIVIKSSDFSLNNDFGEIVAAAILGKVYNDRTNDGMPQAGEPPIGGVTVTLTGTDDLGQPVSLTTTTAPDGTYAFTDLRPGTYTVTETQPDGWTDGKDTAGTAGGTVGNDVISAITLKSGQISEQNNFGELGAPTPLTTVSGTIWYDPNGNGMRDPGENTGIGGATITLKDAAGNVVATTVTDENGHYSFAGIPPGNYLISETQPGDYKSTSPDDLGSAGTPLVVPPAGLTNQDFLETLASISGYVYGDTIDTGARENFEPGIGNVTIKLYNADTGELVATTKTAADGSYSFDGLKPGNYQLVETQPNGWSDDAETVGSLGGDASTNDVITAIPIAAGDKGVDYNFGEQPPVTDPGKTWVAGHVYVDANNNNDLDNGESGLAGVKIELFDAAGNKVAETLTGPDGSYLFNNIDPGAYTIRETQPPDYLSTEEPDNEITAVNVPPSGLPNQDFGERLPGGGTANTFVSGVVWVDRDGDGVTDPGEPGIPGVTITLKDANGNVVGTTVTGPGGYYEFTGIAPGVYTIEETQPNGYADSPGTPAAVISSVTVPLAGLANQNFGEQLSSVEGNVYQDVSGDGALQAGEPPIGGVTITLTGTDVNGNPVSLTTVTDATGHYKFDDLLPPNAAGYTITETQPAGYGDGGDTVGSLGGTGGNDVTSAITFPAGSHGVDYNFGEVPFTPPTDPGTVWVGGIVYLDKDRDGTIDPGDTPIPNVRVSIYDSTGALVGTVLTGADGTYYFTGLTPGVQYTIVQDQPPGYGSSQNPTNSIPVTAPATGGQTGYDFGETLSTISGTVFADTNNDGVRQPGEAPIPGTTVTLTGTAEDGTIVELTTVTGPDGTYSFPDLKAGNYTVTETQPSGWTDGNDTYSGTGYPPITTDDKHTSINIPGGVDAPGYDFGEYNPPSLVTYLEGRVFVDRGPNGYSPDGSYQPGEPGIGGVTIILKDATGTIVATTTTLPDGTYRFPNIPPGTYTVEELQPAGYGSTSPNVLTVDVPLAGKSEVNFGESLGATFGTVYSDLNNNGVRDPGEAGIGGVTITLTGIDLNGNPIIRTTTTNPDGSWAITDLPPSSPAGYTLAETQPAGWFDGSDASSKNGTIGNDVVTGVVIGPGEIKESGNYGEIAPASLGDLVWNDLNGNGAQDAGEPGVDGVKVNLYNTAGALVATTTTANGGQYLFTGLFPGDYIVEFDLTTIPAGSKPTTQNGGGIDEAGDSDADFSTGRTGVISLAPGQDERRVDMGVHISTIDLSVVKKLVGVAVAGRNSTWSLTVSNSATSIDTETGTITVVDVLPSILTFVSATGTGWVCSADGQTVTCTTDRDLAPGKSLPAITVVAKIALDATGEVINTATVTSPGDNTLQPNNSSAAKAPVAKAGTLPGTGTNTAGPLGLAGVLTLLGVALLFLTRRRRSAIA